MRPGRTHYELLNVDPSAGATAIKSAFRAQIARYHPDKVIHLGPEFRDLAERRTAEITSAYKTLMDPASRTQYDAALASRALAAAHDLTGHPRFAVEQAGGDDIVLRAMLGRVRSAVTEIYGPADTPHIRGFELVLVPTAAPALMRSPLPRVFARLRDQIGVAQVRDACVDATRAKLHLPGSPINVLLFGRQLGDADEIAEACGDVRSSRLAGVPPKTHVVVFDAADWRVIVSADSPPALLRFVDRLRS